MRQVEVYKGRTMQLPVSLAFNVSLDSFASDIRVAKSLTSELIASWTISFVTDGRDGEILLTLDHTITEKITKTIGYMDLKWIRGGQPFPVFDEPLEVIFKDSVTA